MDNGNQTGLDLILFFALYCVTINKVLGPSKPQFPHCEIQRVTDYIIGGLEIIGIFTCNVWSTVLTKCFVPFLNDHLAFGERYTAPTLQQPFGGEGRVGGWGRFPPTPLSGAVRSQVSCEQAMGHNRQVCPALKGVDGNFSSLHLEMRCFAFAFC